MTPPMGPTLAGEVAAASDRAGLGAPATQLVLELQSRLGVVAALATELTERGRRPFRPDEAWRATLARLAFDVYALADQTGVDLDASVREVARRIQAAAAATDTAPWPFSG